MNDLLLNISILLEKKSENITYPATFSLNLIY